MRYFFFCIFDTNHGAIIEIFIFLGVEQKEAGFEDVVVTDGIELQKVLDRQRNDPTKATKLSDEEVDLDTARHEDLIYDTQEDGSHKNGGETSLGDSGGRQTFEDEISLESDDASRNNKRRLTSGSDKESKNRHDIRTNRNYELKERLNIDSDGSKDQRHETRERPVKGGKKKLVQSAEQGHSAEFEASVGGRTSSIPDSNLSASTPPPYILKLKNGTPARAELDDIYFLCE